MSKSKEHYCPLDDDASKQLELVIVEHTPERLTHVNVFDMSIINVALPPIYKQENSIN